MDTELLIALLVLWCGSTLSIVIFLTMWFANNGAAFHPHSVDVENRHPTFLVVNSKTVCKKDCAIKSVSAFVAPRGSSSSKHFTALCMMISIAGMLGTTRWYFVEDASLLEFGLAFCGFGALMLVAGFELDVAPERFLEDKMMVTGWLIQKLKMDKLLPFRLGPTSIPFRNFIRNSPEIYHLYEEDRYLSARKAENLVMWNNEILPQSAHMLGAVSYVCLVPAAIMMNDNAEEKVVWITGINFVVFCAMGYFTGNYVPVLRVLRGWVLCWNPFVREPHFMLKLKRPVEAYVIAEQKLRDGQLSTSSEKKENGNGKGGSSAAVDDHAVQHRTTHGTTASAGTRAGAGALRRRTRSSNASGVAGAAAVSVEGASEGDGVQSNDHRQRTPGKKKNGHKNGSSNNGFDSESSAKKRNAKSPARRSKGGGRGRGFSDSSNPDTSDHETTPIRGRVRGRGGNERSNAPARKTHATSESESESEHKGGKSSYSSSGGGGRNRSTSKGRRPVLLDPRQRKQEEQQLAEDDLLYYLREEEMRRIYDSDDNHYLGQAVKRVRPRARSVDLAEAAEADQCLDNAALRFARARPKLYLRVISYILVMTELIAMLTPCVAMGIQWITALCDGPPLLAIMELLYESFICVRTGGLHCQLKSQDFDNCILK